MRNRKITITVSSLNFFVIVVSVFGVGAGKNKMFEECCECECDTDGREYEGANKQTAAAQPLQTQPFRFYPDFQYKFFSIIYGGDEI